VGWLNGGSAIACRIEIAKLSIELHIDLFVAFLLLRSGAVFFSNHAQTAFAISKVFCPNRLESVQR